MSRSQKFLEGMRQFYDNDAPKIDPEAAIMRLKEHSDRYFQKSRFKVGDIVTPVADCGVKGAGEPHIVVEVPFEPIRDFKADVGNSAYGHFSDIRAMCFCGSNVSCFWVESWKLVPYEAKP